MRLMFNASNRPKQDVIPFWTPQMELIVAPQTGLQLLTVDDVSSRVRLGETAIWKKISSGQFPAPILIGTRGKRWVSYEVSNWIRERHERRCKEDPGYQFLTQRLDSIRPQKGSSDSEPCDGCCSTPEPKGSKTPRKAH